MSLEKEGVTTTVSTPEVPSLAEEEGTIFVGAASRPEGGQKSFYL